MYLSLQFIEGGGRRAGVEIEVITTMCNLSFLVERLISGNRSLASVDSLRGPAEAEAENRTRAHQLELQALTRQIRESFIMMWFQFLMSSGSPSLTSNMSPFLSHLYSGAGLEST